MKEFRAQFEFGTAVTEDFREACESVSGKDLNRFFQQWIYGVRYPQYRYGWLSRQIPSGYELSVRLEQIQPWQLFSMPVDIVVTTAMGEQTFVAEDSLAEQVFTFQLADEPLSVEIDPEEWILRTVQQDQSDVEEREPAEGSMRLLPPAPNPFTGATTVRFWTRERGEVEVFIVNVQGLRIRRLFKGELEAGAHEETWDGTNDLGRATPQGIYWVTLETPDGRLTQKLVRRR
jgi:hypothetical protein